MTDNLSRALRKVLGPEWCAGNEKLRLNNCPHNWTATGCTGRTCIRAIAPTPAVAYALAEKVGFYGMEIFAPAGIRDYWLVSARALSGHGERGQGQGPTRAVAECRALLALMERMKETSGD